MTIEIKKNAEQVVISVSGRLDAKTAPEFERVVSEEIDPASNLIIDMIGTEYISSAGLRVILGAQKKMMKHGSMKVTGVCDEVMDIFEMTGFVDILVIE